MDKFHAIVGSKSAANVSVESPNAQQLNEDDKEAGPTPVNDVTNNDEKPAEDAQPGVQKIEAVTLAWGRGSMYTILVLYVFSTELFKPTPVPMELILHSPIVFGFSRWSTT